MECTKCCPSWQCELQSDEVMLAPLVEEMATTNEQTTAFMDANPGSSVGSSAQPLDYELADAQTSASLSEYLSRPVRVATFTWQQSDAQGQLGTTVRPWFEFLNNASIKNKLSNYAFIRGSLKLKVITNASPFLYGSMRMVYQPLPDFTASTITSTVPSNLVPLSQRPGVWITPSHSEGAEFTCPFVYPRSFVRTTVANDVRGLGALEMHIYNVLASANGATSSVSVQIYAWMEDVVIAGPSLGAVLQADEYGVGVVSAPASAVAAAAKTMTRAPLIGRFAKATEIGASAVSNIAKLFGYTNVPVISDPQPMRIQPFPTLASAEIGFPQDKLALDAKNELSIDPSIAGLSGEDEMAVSSFVQRESFLVGSTWSSSQVPDTPLFSSVVVPQLQYNVSNLIDFTPMALAAAMFRNWRGDIIFRFRFIASPFHKGRVRISYDPQATAIQTFGDTGPFVMNRIVDLGAETDVEFRVPYQQALPWCYTTSSTTTAFTTSTTPALTINDTFHNGIISVKVLTALTGPTTTASVGMQVFVRGAENLEFANPSSLSPDLSPFALQSEEYYHDPENVSNTLGTATDASTHRALVNFGETVRSFRMLMRRHNWLDTVYIDNPTASTVGVYRINQTRFPAYYGYDPAGWNSAKGITAPASDFPFNFVNVTPWHLLAPCFIAQRGSMNWIFNPSKGSQGIVSRVSRYNGSFPGYSNGYVSSVATTPNRAEYAYWNSARATTAGSSLIHTNTAAGQAIVAPSFSPFKFQSTRPAYTTIPAGTSSPGYDGTVLDTLSIELPYSAADSSLNAVTVERYFGIGADYSLHFFLNCPTLRYINAATVTPT